MLRGESYAGFIWLMIKVPSKLRMQVRKPWYLLSVNWVGLGTLEGRSVF
jgi:hypothetical protein